MFTQAFRESRYCAKGHVLLSFALGYHGYVAVQFSHDISIIGSFMSWDHMTHQDGANAVLHDDFALRAAEPMLSACCRCSRNKCGADLRFLGFPSMLAAVSIDLYG